jgi:pyridinium-3,5-bisthiocarboxylic acid mononucleotide nickel chelatase
MPGDRVDKAIYFDCFSGVSGDMFLGALLDAGLPLDALREALGSLALEHCRIDARKVMRAGVSATQFVVDETVAPAPVHTHAHSHSHAHTHVHEHRSLVEIEALIAGSALSPTGRARAIALFRRLAEAEAAIHAMPIERVHLHEVGAVDSILDILGGVFAMEWFGASQILASGVNVGSGMVDCAHGRFPVPAPATARLLQGVPIYQAGPAVELTTPTGALLVTGFAERFGPMPEMVVDRIGYGAGSRDMPGHPNVLRVLVGRSVAAQPATERVTMLSFEIDDMNPQLYGALMDALLAAGAHDVYYTPVQMKKNRPGTLVTIVASPERRERLAAIVFRETTTLGVRYHDVLRECLVREERQVATPWGAVRLKLARLGGEITNASPEYDDCVRLAREHGVPVKEVHAAAMKAWFDSRS